MFHPTALILLWICFAVATQSLQAAGLLLAGVPLLVVACVLSTARLLTLLRRTRWIMLSLLLIYAYTTPGEAMWTSLAQFGPTQEGLADGLLQLCRLAFALAGLSIVLSLLSQQQLISGLYTLAYPLCCLGLSRERIAVRMALTLHYAESAMLDTATDWRGSIEHLLTAPRPPEGRASGGVPLAGAPAEVKQHCIELHTTPFTLRDGLLLVVGCALLGVSLL